LCFDDTYCIAGKIWVLLLASVSKLQEKAKRHEQMKYHHDAMIATESFINSVENPEQNVNN